MNERRVEPGWTELRISDSDIDAPEDTESGATRWVRLPSAASGPGLSPASTAAAEASHDRTGLKLRWCAAATMLALVAAAGAVGFAEHRGRTVTTVERVAPPAGGLDAGGCPRGDTCSALDGLYGGLSQAMNTDLPGNDQLFASEMINNTSVASARRLRIVQLRQSGIRVLAINQCRPGPTLRTEPWSQHLTGVGPTLAVLVKPTASGCSLALLADVPAGVPVPVAELQALAADHDSDGG